MDDLAVGSIFRAVRRRRGWRQVDVASRARTSPSIVSRLERGRLDEVSVRAARRVASALEIDLRIAARWRGGELGRLLNERHALLHGASLAMFERLPAWEVVPEVSFAVYGERGIVDLVGWHAETRTLLQVELKSELVDPQELVGAMDRKRRLAGDIGRTRGWRVAQCASWVILADTRTNRRHVARHARLLRTAFPIDGREMRRWLRQPRGVLSALSFLPYPQEAVVGRATTGPRRIRQGPPSVRTPRGAATSPYGDDDDRSARRPTG